MRLCPPGHPLYEYFSRWPRVYPALTAWSHQCREAVAHAAARLNRAGVPAWPRVWPNFKGGGVWDVFYKAADDRLGWLNFAPFVCRPTTGVTDAPVISTVALNCLAPRCGARLYAWMAEVGCRPHAEVPCEFLWDGSVSSTLYGSSKLDADVFAHPEERVAVNCHWTEIVLTGLRLAEYQLECLRHGGPAPAIGADGQVVAEERWTPLARRVYEAWQSLMATADLAEIMAEEKARAKKKQRVPGHRNRVPLSRKPAHVKRAFLRILSPPPSLPPPAGPSTS